MPEWLEHAIFYEIYPQSFKDSNADGIGDINGIIQKLDYINNLGCNAIWLNPCFESPFKDAGYDISDYYKIASRYGTNEDIRLLFDEVHKRNMHILLDLVPGHTSDQHEWFKSSLESEKNEYSDRYIWTNSIWENPDSLLCIRGISDRDGSCGVNFFSSQPALNYGYNNPIKDYQMHPNSEEPMKTREEIKNIMKFWMDMGCDGFRVDMAGSLVKNDLDGTENIKLWKYFRNFFDNEYPNAVIISEWGEPKKAIQGGFHMDFLLHFGPACYTTLFRSEKPFFSKSGKGDISTFKEQYGDYYSNTKGKGFICIPSGNHDMERLSKGKNEEEMKVCFAFLLSMPGAPFIYYGDEIAMKYVEGLTSVEGGYSRTGSRTPMQWNDEVNAGFSNGKPDSLYIRLDDGMNRPTVQKQLEDENSLLNEVKKLIKIRKKNKPLWNNSEFEFVYAEKNEYPFVYKRKYDMEEILIVLNPANKEVHCNIGEESTNIIYAIGGVAKFEDGCLIVPPVSATFFSL